MRIDEYFLVSRLGEYGAADILYDAIDDKHYMSDFCMKKDVSQETAALLVLVKSLIERVEELECIVGGITDEN